MEGRILRRQADLKAPWPGDGSRDGAAIRRILGRATTITIAALLLATLTLVTTSIAGVGVSSAKVLELHVGRQEPSPPVDQASTPRDRLRDQQAAEQARPAGSSHQARPWQGRQAALAVHEAPSLLRPPVPGGGGPREPNPPHQLPALQVQLAGWRDDRLGGPPQGDAARDRPRLDAQPCASTRAAGPRPQAGGRGDRAR